MYYVTQLYSNAALQAMAEWVALMMDAAANTAARIGCSPEAIVAQAALESAWGRASIGNNVFGIKASSSWTGPVIVRRTAEQTSDGHVYYVDAAFRDYATMADSVRDHFDFLRANSRYETAGVFRAANDHEYFVALKRAGYATDVDYVSKLDAVLARVKDLTATMSTDAAAPPSVPPLMMIGTKGAAVRALQQTLAHIGMYPLSEVDGDFGPLTQAAVINYQGARGLDADGIVGPATRAALDKDGVR